MTKIQILEKIQDKMNDSEGDVFTFIDWLEELVNNELSKYD